MKRKPPQARHERAIRRAIERLLRRYGYEAVRYATNRLLKFYRTRRSLQRTIEERRKELDALQRKLRVG